jgi:hypothetical protein
MKHQAPSLRVRRSPTMPIIHLSNRQPDAPCNSAGTQSRDIQNEPSPIFGHLAAVQTQPLGQPHPIRHPRPRSHHQKLTPAVSALYPQYIQACRSPYPRVYSTADPARNTSAPTRPDPETSIYRTNLVPFRDTVPPIAAGSPRTSITSPPALCSALQMHDTNRLTSGSV